MTIKAKRKNKMLALRKMIEKSLPLQDSFLTTSLPDLDAPAKAYFPINTPLKVLTNRENLAKIDYFDP